MFSIPLHPLLVHFAVVLIPLTALMLLLVVFFASYRTRIGSWLPVFGVATAVAAQAASSFGERLVDAKPHLEQHIHEHEEYGEMTAFSAIALGIACLLVWAIYSAPFAARITDAMPWLLSVPMSIVIKVAAIAVGITATVLMVLAGHSGSESVWLEH